MKLSSVITPMTEGATPLMSPTMNPSRRRSVRKTSGRTASSTTKRLPSMKLSRFAELPWLKTVISKDRRFVELSMSLSVGPNRKNCFINYEKIAINEIVQICRTPVVKDCDIQGPEICRTEYESECWTKQEEHDVEDDVVECETIQDEKCQDE